MKILRGVAVLALLLLFTLIGFAGIDFGEHPDWVVFYRHALWTWQDSLLLPRNYIYPSVTYWIDVAATVPDAVAAVRSGARRGDDVQQSVVRAIQRGSPFEFRLRRVYVVATGLTIVWLYLLVRLRGGGEAEALLAGAFLAASWEVGWHARFVKPDAILMQIGVLPVAFALLASRRPPARRWLRAAAACAGLAAGTKYPGGLLLVPVLIALPWDAEATLDARTFLRRTADIVGVFLGAYLLSTPGTLLDPTIFASHVLMGVGQYAEGWYGWTIAPGLPHLRAALVYYGLVVPSPIMPVALLFGLLVPAGAWALWSESRRDFAVLASFPALYTLYFSLQRVMIVRNLLVVVPFLVLFSARGAVFVGERLRGRALRTAWATLLVVALVGSAAWQIRAADMVRDRRTDRFVREMHRYVAGRSDAVFLLSPRARARLDAAGIAAPPNAATDTAAAFDFAVFSPEEREGSWPYNDPFLVDAWFGPFTMNPDYERYDGDWFAVMRAGEARRFGLPYLGPLVVP